MNQIGGHDAVVDSSNGETGPTAPVSHQKRCERNAMNAIEIEQKCREFNEADRYSAAHNGLVAGSSPAGPTTRLYR
jgi:hypothetical protein